ncbi:MAG: molybdate ABC transporter substrate-binding protein [Rhodobacteraceae bacterium]|nr:molybdate ABC transporter substrate-binding protein [Paracoccaceae bacterium]
MPSRLSLLMIPLLVWMMAGQPVQAQSRPVTVFAAASLKTALDDVVTLYGDETGKTVHISYAASSALAWQIRYGAPADIFISANSGWMDWLQQDGLLRDETRIDLLSNRLVLIAAPGNNVQLEIAPGFDLAGAIGKSRLAMALTDAVPAGIYGRASLQHLGVWDNMADRIAQSDNVRTALIHVATGQATLGIVYATDAMADPRVRIVGEFPSDSHPEILYPAALLNENPSPDAVLFFGFLNGDKARLIFDENGFDHPDGTP